MAFFVSIGGGPMAAKKRFDGVVALHLPKELNQAIRAAAAATGKSISNVIRESLQVVWGSQPKEDIDQLAQAGTA